MYTFMILSSFKICKINVNILKFRVAYVDLPLKDRKPEITKNVHRTF